MTVPMVSSNTTHHCKAADQSGDFLSGMVVASQNYNPFVLSRMYLHSPGCEDPVDCSSCLLRILQPEIEQFTYTTDFHACRDYVDEECISWLKMCKERVYGINFQIDDPTFSSIAFAFSPNFSQCFAAYPLPLHEEEEEEEESAPYVYHILHGSQREAMLSGFSIQNPYDIESAVSLRLTGPALGWMNGEALVRVKDKLSVKCREVLWVEPDHEDSLLPPVLSGTVLTSSTPLNVFTNLAMLENLDPFWEFGFDSQVIHQMPERRRWGKQFLVSPLWSDVLLPKDIQSCLLYKITIVSYVAENRIQWRSGLSSQSLELKVPAVSLSDEHFEFTLTYNRTQMEREVYLELTSSSPVMVLSEAFTSKELSSTCAEHSFHYSTLVQPVEWHANKQIVLLVHPKPNTTYTYHISVTVPREKANPKDIIESEPGQYCNGLPLSHHDSDVHSLGDSHTLVTYTKSVRNVASRRGQPTRLLLRHSDPNIHIGVTVYAYSNDGLHYSYSNGYTLGTQQL